MATDYEQLVNLVTAEVVKMLQQRGMVQTSSGQRADVRPPIGQCTGDYSKFPELKGRGGGTGPAKPSQDPTPASPSSVAPLSGVVTASQLQEAMNASADGVALLAPDAKLSPLANDLIRQHPQKIRRAAAGEMPTQSTTAPSNWMWWIDGQCPVVNEIVGTHRDQLQSIAASRASTSLGQVVRELASAVKAKRVAGGILFVHNAARAMCFANRCQSLRAVVGTCGEAVEQGITDLGANVLVVEYPHHGLRSMGAMVSRVLQQPPAAPAAVLRDLGDLHRCG